MSTLHRSTTVTVFLDQRGFVEFVVRENQTLTIEELEIIAQLLKDKGLTDVRVLVNRVNEYKHSENYLLHNLKTINGLQLERVSYFAPSLQSKIYSEVIKLTTLREVPTRIFSGKQEAIDWLLSDEPVPLENTEA